MSGVIVNFRTPELVIDGASSLLADGVEEVVVVDNDSGDGSLDRLNEFGDPRVNVVASQRNNGFGSGANLAARHARADLLFFLNSDATVRPGCLGRLAAALEERDVGVTAPRVLTPSGTEQADAYGTFPTFLTTVTRRNRRPTPSLEPDWVSGVALMTRRKEFVSVGGFDERLHMYFEDVLLCHRYRESGLRIRREPAAEVVHLGQASAATPATKMKQYDEAQLRYFELIGMPVPQRMVLTVALSVAGRLGMRAGGRR